LEALTRSFPAVLEYQSDAGVALCNQARLLAQRGEKQQAGQLVRQAIELQEKAVKNNPRHLKYQAFLKEHKDLLAKLKDGQSKADEAKASRQ
jgi:hypothetical protein